MLSYQQQQQAQGSDKADGGLNKDSSHSLNGPSDSQDEGSLPNSAAKQVQQSSIKI